MSEKRSLRNPFRAGVRDVRGLILALMCFTSVLGCSSLVPVPGIPDRKADLYSVSMMGADLVRGGILKVTTCSSRYMDVD